MNAKTLQSLGNRSKPAADYLFEPMPRSVSKTPMLTISQLTQLTIKEFKSDLEKALQVQKTIKVEDMPNFVKTAPVDQVTSSNCQTPSAITKAETIPAKVLEQKILES